MENKIIIGLIAIVVIVVAVIFAGCIILDTTSPSGVVETFASLHRDGDFEACYFLMSTEYKNLDDEKAFRDKIKHYNDYYLIKVKSEEINGDTASVEIEYVKRLSYDEFFLSRELREWLDKKSKTLNLVKEEDGWKLAELYCELKSK